MKYLGMNGFVDIVRKCMDNTKYLSRRIEEIEGLKIAATPIMNVVGITTESGQSICQIDEELRKRNWMVGKFEQFNLIRVVVMPHIQKEHLENFTEDLRKIIKNLHI
jgi:tyrosine decarboxylase/aspartate 1-decarboxylase